MRATFIKPSWWGEIITFSGDTDCYQPLEASYGLTRRCLEVCLEFGNPLESVTKSFLIVRDLEFLKELHERTHLGVTLSIPFLDDKIARQIEPNAASIPKRFEAMERLSAAGIHVNVNIAPVIPGLNDSDIPGILKKSRACGAEIAELTLLRLPGSVREFFSSRIKELFLLAHEKILGRIRKVRSGRLYNSEFGKHRRGEGPYWENIEKIFELSCRQLDLNCEQPPESRPPFRCTSSQKELLFSSNPEG